MFMISTVMTTCAERQGIVLTSIRPAKPPPEGLCRASQPDSPPQMTGTSHPLNHLGGQVASRLRWTCNNERPNMGIGGVTSAMTLDRAA